MCVHKSLSVKHFHAVPTRHAHECLLKSSFGKARYNPIERCWGILENHWNGALLDSIDAVIRFATTMTWKGKCPVVELVTTTYQIGVKLTKEAMQMVEAQLQRLPGLEKWFVDIIHYSG